MRKLMSANLRRLWLNKYLWVTCAVCLVLCLFGSLQSYESARRIIAQGDTILAEEYLFNMVPLLGLSVGVFISLFLGTEHGDGTLRNKLTVGKTRGSVYLASFFICFFGSLLLLAFWFLGSFVFLPLSGLSLEYGWGNVALTVVLLIGTQAVYSATFAWIGNLSSNKALTEVYSLLAFGIVLILSSGIYDRLCEPEFRGGAMLFINGSLIPQETSPNPLFLSGSIREFFQAALELLPTGQGILIANLEVIHPVRMLLFSLALTAVINLLGMLHFQKKDLK